MNTSGYKSHNRNGGWNRGTYAQEDVPFTLTHDRDIEFLVTSLTSNPQTDYRNKRVTVLLDQIQSKCYKLHSLCSDITEEVNGPC